MQNSDGIQELVLVGSYGQNDGPSMWYKFQTADVLVLEKNVYDPHPKTVHLRAVRSRDFETCVFADILSHNISRRFEPETNKD